MGPTAGGKTDAALALCREFPFEIVSVDSSLVYRGMDIGTAKPPPDVLRRVPHHLVDIREPHETYSAGAFRSDALRAMDAIGAAGKIPLLVGGTMFYFRVLQSGLAPLPPANPQLRAQIEARATRAGWAALHRELQRLDPSRAERIDPNDRQRVQRALEIVLLTGASVPAGPTRRARPPWRIAKVALAPADRRVLHARIEARFSKMLSDGLVEEVERLLARPQIDPELPALRTVGYRQVAEYLIGKLRYNDMIEQGIAATRQLAKRQLTWLRNQSGVTWIGDATVVRGYVDAKLTALRL